MGEDLYHSRKEELNRRASFAVRHGNISGIQKYHEEIREFELLHPQAGKVMNHENWEHLDFLYKKAGGEGEQNSPETS